MIENEYYSLSLLYPEGEKKNNPLSKSAVAGLELDRLLSLNGSSVGDYYTCDIDVIKYRQKVFADLSKSEEARKVLVGILPYLSDIVDLRRIGDTDEIGESYLCELTEIEVYHSLIRFLHDELLPLEEKFESEALKSFCSRIRELSESEYYADLTKHLDDLANRVRDIRSITIGINLDARMMPESAGVISLNNDKFHSGKLFERIKRLDFKNDEMTFLADVIPFSDKQPENQRIALKNTINNAVANIFKSSVSSWKKAIKTYVLSNTDFLLSMAPEIEFVTKAAELIEKLESRGLDIVYPEITNNNKYCAYGLINPIIALETDSEMIPNDISYENGTTLFVITGPNRGGKSAFTCAVGLSFVMAGLGLPVTAKSCEICPADKILTHFPTESEDTVEKGRLGEECSRLNELLDEVTEDSLVLLDESLSSTGSYEGAIIASEVLEGLSMIKCRGIFSTHLHNLAASVNEINKNMADKGGKIENLVAQALEAGQRSFKILRKDPDGKSYARDIAEKYGLSHDEIAKKIEKKAKRY